MKISVQCMSCFSEDGRPCWNGQVQDVTETGVYLFLCPDGGVTATILQAERHEILVNISLENFAKGSFIEAVIISTTAIERFLSYVTRLVWVIDGGSIENFVLLHGRLDVDKKAQKGSWAHFCMR